MMGRADI
jgi:FKBP12-rapamycin complex-associated protein